jgi:hypothetical protein
MPHKAFFSSGKAHLKTEFISGINEVIFGTNRLASSSRFDQVYVSRNVHTLFVPVPSIL